MKDNRTKTTSVAKLTLSKLPATYAGLCKLHLPRPIHDKVGFDNTIEVLDALALPFANGYLNADQEDYIALLTDLVEAYEKATLPAESPPSGLSVLKYLMEEHTMSGDGLASILGVDRSVAYRILKGERGLTTAHLKALGLWFGVSPGVFIGE